MFCICVLIIAAAAVYMVEAYIHTYYAIEYMHGAPLFFVLLAKYAAPVLFLLLCGYFVFRYKEKRRESEKPAQDMWCPSTLSMLRTIMSRKIDSESSLWASEKTLLRSMA